jgi:uncharacterized protein (DUF1697 family)
MKSWVALLRAVNVGGTGKLPMALLREMAEAAGFAEARTYIASGNLVFRSGSTREAIRSALEARLEAYAGKLVGVLIRDAAEMERVRADNPFAGHPGNRTIALFTDEPVSADTLKAARHVRDEQMMLGPGVVYIFYGDGMADSRLIVPVTGTTRNINTVTKLAEMAAAI